MIQQFMHTTEILIDFCNIPPRLVVIMEVEMVGVSAMKMKIFGLMSVFHKFIQFV